jgi:large subunit ribosomal protein L6
MLELEPGRNSDWMYANQQPVHSIVSGPLGTLTVPCPLYIDVNVADSKALVSTATPEVRKHREMWGTIRSHVQNLVTGVSEGHTAILRLVGVGYRATIEDDGKKVGLKVGYSHPVELPIPKGVKASTPQPTRILLEGADKYAVKQFAADIRKWREPEPYKGKGIFIDNEDIKLKAKKVK